MAFHPRRLSRDKHEKQTSFIATTTEVLRCQEASKSVLLLDYNSHADGSSSGRHSGRIELENVADFFVVFGALVITLYV